MLITRSRRRIGAAPRSCYKPLRQWPDSGVPRRPHAWFGRRRI